MKSIDEIYSATEMSNEGLNNGNNNDNGTNNIDKKSKKPKYFLIFIDEINRFLPNTATLGTRNAVAEQIMKTIIAGRSRHTILFSAKQFKSAVDYSLHENTGLHITAKVGLSELSSMPYNVFDQSTKMNIVRLNKGELVMVHSAFRHPIKITFPNSSLGMK
jgi:DNA helicase HerA-like ATPase